MQCQRCGFENMPGLTTCARCQTVLAATAPVDVCPPRAGRAKFLRPLRYRLNRLFRGDVGGGAERAAQRAAEELSRRIGPTVAGLLSVVPGLGHLLWRRLREIRWLWPGWFGALAAGLLLYGTLPGGILIGVAIALHTWIACDAGKLMEQSKNPAARILTVMFIFIALAVFLYGGVRAAAGQVVRGGFAAADLPSHGIRHGDYLLLWRDAYAEDEPRKGDVILYRYRGGTPAQGYRVHGGEALSEVIGLPGEAARLGDRTVRVPAGHYLCQPPELTARGQAHGGRGLDQGSLLGMTAMPSRGDIEGRAFMVYNPIRRRRFIPRGPADSTTDPP